MGTARGTFDVRGPVAVGFLAFTLLAGAAASALVASEFRAPLEVDLHLRRGGLDWQLRALQDAAVVGVEWRTYPAKRLAEPPSLQGEFRRGQTRSGALRFVDDETPAWVELRVRVRSAGGEAVVGGSARLPVGGAGVSGARVRHENTASKPTPGRIRVRFLYEDRILGPLGYTGEIQRLPIRHADVDLMSTDGMVLVRSRTDAAGRVDIESPSPDAGPRFLRLRTQTSNHPRIDLAVWEPVRVPGGQELHPHAVETLQFVDDGDGVDLGDFVLFDPDGFGRAQAFHILDVALDAWEALASDDLLGQLPPDSLRLFWGPQLRLRTSGYGGGAIEIASPASGDTDGWSDAVILHEIGHFVSERWLRDDSAGGIHLLGDVEQELRLAYAEGLATAFACIVREHRAATRVNLAGQPIDTRVAWYVDSGLPPPDGIGGSLELAWDVEAHEWLDGRQLPRAGIGSESNIAATLWDLSDGPTTADGDDQDDDRMHLGSARVWSLLRGLRDLPQSTHVTFEHFWDAAAERLSAAELERAREEFVRTAGIEFVSDAAEPDDDPESAIVVQPTPPTPVTGGIVIDEVDPGVTPAVEITNRGSMPQDLSGWALRARRNGASTNPGLTYTFPDDFQLGPGARVVVHRGGDSAEDTPRDLFATKWTVPWFPETNGGLILVDAAERAVDFVRWDGRTGNPSELEVPPETLFHGRLEAPLFGHTLTRRADRDDTDDSSDFVSALPTLGVPNDAATLHRTFFPRDDTDAVRIRVSQSGVYTLRTLRLQNGAQPLVTLRSADARRPPVYPRRLLPQHESRLTLWLEAGEELTALVRHGGKRTRYGVYDVAVYAERDTRVALAPEGLRFVTASSGAQRRVTAAWWNVVVYDSLHVRLDGRIIARLGGGATAWESEVPIGRHRLQIVGFVGGVAASTPELVVAAEELPERFADDFDTLDPEVWEVSGAWGAGPAPGRAGRALTDSPEGAYADRIHETVRLRTGVRLPSDAVLCFDHICVVRPEDTAALEISTDWGARWEELGRWHLRLHAGLETPADWSDGTADAEDWVHECIPLADFADQPIQLRFRLQSDLHGRADGWYVDALRIENAIPTPVAVRLGPVVPNPFNPRTRIEYTLVRREHVQLVIFDVRGRLVRVLVDSVTEAGAHDAIWDGRDVLGRQAASGVYIANLRAGVDIRNTKLVLLR